MNDPWKFGGGYNKKPGEKLTLADPEYVKDRTEERNKQAQEAADPKPKKQASSPAPEQKTSGSTAKQPSKKKPPKETSGTAPSSTGNRSKGSSGSGSSNTPAATTRRSLRIQRKTKRGAPGVNLPT